MREMWTRVEGEREIDEMIAKAIIFLRRLWQPDMALKFLHMLPLWGCVEVATHSLSTNSYFTVIVARHGGFSGCPHNQWLPPASPASPSSCQAKGIDNTLIPRQRLTFWLGRDFERIRLESWWQRYKRCEARVFQRSIFVWGCSKEEGFNHQWRR